MSKIWAQLWRRQNDERGAILVMATAGILVAVVASALAVDLGTLAQERRSDQAIADLAALDASRDIANMQVRADQSAGRNGFPTGPGYSVVAVEGTKVNGTCQAAAGAGKVCVTVTSPHKNSFRPGGRSVVTRAVAGPQAPPAGFWMGSSLAGVSLDDATENLPLLNRVFGRWLGGPTGDATVVSYKGLADANVKLRQLQAALGLATPTELMTANITMGQLLTATAVVLNNQNTVASLAARTDILSLASTTTSTAQFKLGDYIKVQQGLEEKALDADFNVFDLIAGGAEVANKNTFIDAGTIITLPVTLPAPLSTTANITTKLGIKVIEGPKHYFGTAPGPIVSTSQIELTLTPHIDVNFTSQLFNVLSLLVPIGSASLKLVGDMPVKFTAGGADGNLTQVRCTSPQGINVSVTSRPIVTHAEGNLSIFAQGTTQLIGANIKVNVAVQPSDVSSTAGGPYNLAFNYPSDFSPTDPDGQTTPGAPVGLTMTTTNVNTTVGAAGLTEIVGILTGTLKLDVVESAIIGPILNPVFNAVANHLTTPALKALGLAIGPVDVWAPVSEFNPATCGQPGLLG